MTTLWNVIVKGEVVDQIVATYASGLIQIRAQYGPGARLSAPADPNAAIHPVTPPARTWRHSR